MNTGVLVIGIVVALVVAVIAGIYIYGTVYDWFKPTAGDFWQNLVTFGVALILAIIVGKIVFVVVYLISMLLAALTD